MKVFLFAVLLGAGIAAAPALLWAGGNTTYHKNDVGEPEVAKTIDRIAPECEAPCDVNEGLYPEETPEEDWSLPESRIAMSE